jgi:hypothetical protein
MRRFESISIFIVTRGIWKATIQAGNHLVARYRQDRANHAAKKHYRNNQDEYYTTALADARSKGVKIKTLSALTLMNRNKSS